MAYFSKGGPKGPNDGAADAESKFAMLAEVRAYWEGLRIGGDLPRRDAIDPRGIAGALENTFLLERVAPGVARFRLAGMQLHDLMGMDVRGMPLTALIDPAGRTRLGEQLEQVFAGPSTLEVWLDAERGLGRPALEGRMLLLPLISTRGTPDLALGCLAIHGALGRAPRRFAISGVVGTKLSRPMADRATADRPTPDKATAPQPAPQPVLQGLSESPLPFTPRPPRSKPNLRLVHSRD